MAHNSYINVAAETGILGVYAWIALIWICFKGLILLSKKNKAPIPYIMGTGLQLKLDMFRYVFVLLTSFIWFMSTIYSTQFHLRNYFQSKNSEPLIAKDLDAPGQSVFMGKNVF